MVGEGKYRIGRTLLTITAAQMQAFDAQALDEFCVRAVRALFGTAEAGKAQSVGRMRELVLAFRGGGVVEEDDVARLARALWPTGPARLRKPDLAEILGDPDRPGWLKVMQAIAALEAAGG